MTLTGIAIEAGAMMLCMGFGYWWGLGERVSRKARMAAMLQHVEVEDDEPEAEPADERVEAWGRSSETTGGSAAPNPAAAELFD